MTVDDRRARLFNPRVTVGYAYSVELTFTDSAAAPVAVSAPVAKLVARDAEITLSTALASNVLSVTMSGAQSTTAGEGSWPFLVAVTIGGTAIPVLTGTMTIDPAGRGAISDVSEEYTLLVGGSTAVAVSVVGGGGGGGGTPATTVVTETSYGQASSAGVGAAYAREDHSHGTPALPTPGDIGAATAAQGALADTAVQPADLATVATTGAYGDLSGTPTLGSAAAAAATDFAPAAHVGSGGAAHANAVAAGAAGFMTGADKSKLDGIEAGAEVNDVTSVAGRTGAVVLSNADISGLGGAAVLNVGTTAGTVAAGNDSRLSDARTPTAHGNEAHTSTFITASSLPGAASDSAAGIVELATTAETQTGTDSTRAVTPAGASATYVPQEGATKINYAVTPVAATGATENIDMDVSFHDLTMDQACTFTFTNKAAAGEAKTIVFKLSGAFTATFTDGEFGDGAAPAYTSPSWYTATSIDGDTKVLIAQIAKAVA